MTEQLVIFMWKEARPDSREFRQNSSLLEPQEFAIGVPIPLTNEYIHNAEAILSAQLGSGNVDIPKPIYKNKAIQFALDYLGEYLRDPEDVTPKDLQSADDDWGDNEPIKTAKEESDPWKDAVETDEKWNEKEESWE